MSSPSVLTASNKICGKWLQCPIPPFTLLIENQFHFILKALQHCMKETNYIGIRIFCQEVCSYKINKLLETHFFNLKSGNDLIMTSYGRGLRTMGKFIRKGTRCPHEGNLQPQSWQKFCQCQHVCWAVVRLSHAEPGNCWGWVSAVDVTQPLKSCLALHLANCKMGFIIIQSIPYLIRTTSETTCQELSACVDVSSNFYLVVITTATITAISSQEKACLRNILTSPPHTSRN